MNILTGLGLAWGGGALSVLPTALAMRRSGWGLVLLLAVGWPAITLGAAVGLVKIRGGPVEGA